MSDSLRDRVTRVLNRELLAQLPDALSNGGDLAPSPSGTINLQHLAAVVIAELGLRKQSQTGEIVNVIEGDAISYGRHRYVTEWETNE